MDISESVLFSELAQLDKKEKREASGKQPYDKPSEPVLTKTPQLEKVNELKKYEREIIKILLLYGNKEVDFVDFEAPETIDTGKPQKLKKVHITNLVSKEIYLNLQEDEVEFTDVIEQLNQNESISVDVLVNNSNPEIANLVTNILMDDEKYVLSNWERKNIFTKSKESDLSKMVLDAIYNLRRVLIEQKINSLQLKLKSEVERDESMLSIIDYNALKVLVAERLARVV
jgi:DNA primase